MRVYVTNGPRNGLNIGRKVGPCPGNRRRWVLGSVYASSEAVCAANTHSPRFQVRAQPSSCGLKVPCSYKVSARGKYALLMYLSEFRLRVSSF